MSKTLTALVAASFLFLIGCGDSPSPVEKIEPEITPVVLKLDTAERLAEEYAKAFKAHDAEAVKALFCWDGVKGRMLHQQQQIAVMSFGEGMNDIVVDEVPPSIASKLSGVERNDKLLVPNIEVTKVLRVTHSNNGVGWLPIGKKDGQWKIAATVETELVETVE